MNLMPKGGFGVSRCLVDINVVNYDLFGTRLLEMHNRLLCPIDPCNVLPFGLRRRVNDVVGRVAPVIRTVPSNNVVDRPIPINTSCMESHADEIDHGSFESRVRSIQLTRHHIIRLKEGLSFEHM